MQYGVAFAYLASSRLVYNIPQLVDTKSGHLVPQIGYRRPAGFKLKTFSPPRTMQPLPH